MNFGEKATEDEKNQFTISESILFFYRQWRISMFLPILGGILKWLGDAFAETMRKQHIDRLAYFDRWANVITKSDRSGNTASTFVDPYYAAARLVADACNLSDP